MKRHILIPLALLFSTPALAQAWTVGAQTPSYPGGASGTYTGIVGDGSTTQGGTPPAEAYEPAVIPSTGITVSDWIAADVSRTSSSGAEAKARFVCNASHEAREDPIVYPGMVMAGHDHTFFGNPSTGKDSTYASLRASTGLFTCPGGPDNKTAYWSPSVKKVLASGIAASIKPDFVAFYYVHNETDAPSKYRILRDINFIGGVNPADPTNAIRLAEIPLGFTVSAATGINGTGFRGWACYSADGSTITQTALGTDYSDGFVTAGGADPWNGACTAGMLLIAVIDAPDCWDGVNLHSPDGRGHFRYRIRHVNSGANVCPTGWWSFPTFESKEAYSHNGPTDYMTWYLSSDRAMLSAPNWRRAGTTFHFDWWGAWDDTVFQTWLVHCTGVKIGATAGDPAQCADGTISATQRLKSHDAPPVGGLSNNPILTIYTYYDDAATARYFPLASGTTGPFTLHGH